MLNRNLHKAILVNLLKDIYGDPDLRTILGFKGGTASFLFYDLPRFSVDLDFDLLNENRKEDVLTKGAEILKKHGVLTEAIEKRYTLFFLLSYQKGQRNVKVEISKRPSPAIYEVKQYLGIPVLTMRQEDMAASKLGALLTRTHFAARDMFDLWFYLKNHWLISETTLKKNTGFSLKEAINKAIARVDKISRNQLLQGLGELLLDQKQKVWVREKLKEELLFQLNLYLKTHT